MKKYFLQSTAKNADLIPQGVLCFCVFANLSPSPILSQCDTNYAEAVADLLSELNCF